MSKCLVGDKITITGTFRDSDDELADPTSVTFGYRIGYWRAEESADVTRQGTGVYTVEITPDVSGNLYGVFRGIGDLVKTIPVHVPIYPEQLPVGLQNQISGG